VLGLGCRWLNCVQVGVGSSEHEHERPVELSTKVGEKLVTAVDLQCFFSVTAVVVLVIDKPVFS
jgi:hypothetical protein